MTKKKKLLIALGVIVALVAIVVLVNLFTGKDKALYAVPATETVIAREGTYQAYLDKHGYADLLAASVIEVDIFAFEKSEDSNAQRRALYASQQARPPMRRRPRSSSTAPGAMTTPP